MLGDHGLFVECSLGKMYSALVFAYVRWNLLLPRYGIIVAGWWIADSYVRVVEVSCPSLSMILLTSTHHSFFHCYAKQIKVNNLFLFVIGVVEI